MNNKCNRPGCNKQKYKTKSGQMNKYCGLSCKDNDLHRRRQAQKQPKNQATMYRPKPLILDRSPPSLINMTNIYPRQPRLNVANMNQRRQNNTVNTPIRRIAPTYNAPSQTNRTYNTSRQSVHSHHKLPNFNITNMKKVVFPKNKILIHFDKQIQINAFKAKLTKIRDNVKSIGFDIDEVGDAHFVQKINNEWENIAEVICHPDLQKGLIKTLEQNMEKYKIPHISAPIALKQTGSSKAVIKHIRGNTLRREAKKILFYQKDQPYYEFTNFYESPIKYKIDGKQYVFPTSEHAFQAMKFSSATKSRTKHDMIEAVSRLNSARDSFNFVRQPQNAKQIRPDWDTVKDQVMYEVLLHKFSQNSHLKELLVSTGEAMLVEHTNNDSYWGDDNGSEKGLNRLGYSLMKVRNHLQPGIYDKVKNAAMLFTLA